MMRVGNWMFSVEAGPDAAHVPGVKRDFVLTWEWWCSCVSPGGERQRKEGCKIQGGVRVGWEELCVSLRRRREAGGLQDIKRMGSGSRGKAALKFSNSIIWVAKSRTEKLRWSWDPWIFFRRASSHSHAGNQFGFKRTVLHSASTLEKSGYSNFNWNIKIMLINICKECCRKASEEIQFWKWGLSKVK